MSEALVIMIVLTAALLIAVIAVLVLARRRPPAAPGLDEETLRRLVEQAVSHSSVGTSPATEPAAEPDLGRFALLSHEATKRKRRLRGSKVVNQAQEKQVKSLLPYKH